MSDVKIREGLVTGDMVIVDAEKLQKLITNADNLKAERDSLRARIADLTRNLAEERARLDWLDGQKYGAWGITCDTLTARWVKQIETGGYAVQGANIREAIDAARKAEK